VVLLSEVWIHDFGKFKMVLSKNDKDVSAQIKKFGWYEDEKLETEVFAKQLKKGMTVFDLGANIGFYSMLARSAVGSNGRVVCFEPFPQNADLLRKSIDVNSFSNIELVEAAVSNKGSYAFLHLSPDYNSEHSLLDLEFNYAKKQKQPKQIEVKTVTLDDYCQEKQDFHVDLIKMDIEGYEIKALKGMSRVINSNENLVLMTEFWPNGFIKNNSSPDEFLETLERFGFKIFHIDSQLGKLYEVDSNKMMEIYESRSKDITDQTMLEWGWFTNLLCIKNS
jgi:FkbM family methyltransferase